MDCKKKDGVFRIAGIVGLLLLLGFFVWARNRDTGSATQPKSTKHDQSTKHDHSNPAEHGDIKAKELGTEDSELKTSGKITNGKRVVQYEAFKFAFSPDPLIVRNGETIVLKLKSRDVEHGMIIPEIDFNSNIPAKGIKTVSFKAPSKPGKYPIFCSVYCGTGHGKMQGTLLVLPDK